MCQRMDAGAWLPWSRGTAAPSAEWLENEFSFSLFLSLVPDGLISHFATSQEVLCLDAALAIKRRAWPANVRMRRLRFMRWSYCWLPPCSW